MKRLKIYILVMVAMLLLIGCVEAVNESASTKEENTLKIEKSIEQKRQITITAVGDVMTHLPQLWPHYDGETKTYDFNNNYKYIREIIKESHISMCNLETALGGGEEYTGYPLFNTPDEIVKALKNANFNTMILANNHIFDQGKEGLFRTVRKVRTNGFDTVGVHHSNENKFTIKQVGDVRIGICAYVYESGSYAKNKSINGLVLPKDLEEHINSFHPDKLEETKASMKEKIDAMIATQVDIKIFYIHWGIEYDTKESTYQREIAAYLASQNVDVVFGSHPHVIQPIEMIGDTAVFYSLGNFISNQRAIYTEDRNTEDGMIGHVTFEIDHQKNVSIKEVKCIPTWVNMYYEPSMKYYEIMPVIPYMTKEIKINEKLQKTFENTKKILKIDNPILDENGIIIYTSESKE